VHDLRFNHVTTSCGFTVVPPAKNGYTFVFVAKGKTLYLTLIPQQYIYDNE